MGRGASSRLVPPSKTEHWSSRASMLGRSTLRAVGPTDATSIANKLDSRNPDVRLRTSCPERGLLPPRCASRSFVHENHRRGSDGLRCRPLGGRLLFAHAFL